MPNEISKSDWKHFKKVREVALERLCSRILDNVSQASSDVAKTAHERFLAVYKIVNDSNDDIARGFDDLSRSRMILHVLTQQSLGLITKNEMEGFSEKVRERISNFKQLG